MAHVTDGMASQVQPAAQSAAVVQVTGSAWQLEVVAAGQSHVVVGGGFEGVPPSELGAEPALAQAQPELSAMQLKPAPQSASALHGAS
jgi:hypothetical protein